jgi:flagellar hook-associated protein 1 FlgK
MGSGIFSIGARAMQASQSQLDTVSHNISNANTVGYSRQQVEVATEGGLYTGAGFFGRGVRVATVTRSANEFLTKEANVNTAASSADQTRLAKLKQLETILPTGEAGLGYAASQVLNAFVDVANQPQDMSARQVVLSRAQEWVSRTNTAGQQLAEHQAGVKADLGTSVGQINSLTKQIATINDSIARYSGSGQQPNDLLDQRDQLIKQLNQQIQVTTTPADDGSLNVFTGGGQLLVLGSSAETLSVVPDPNDSSLARIALVTNGSARILDSDQFTGGAVKGLLQYQDEDLASTKAQLNAFVSGFADAVNAQQALGMDSSGNVQTTFDVSGTAIASNPIFGNTATASGLTLELKTPTGLAVASPLVATVATTNKGTAAVDTISMNRALPTGNALDATSSQPTSTQPLTVLFKTDPSDSTKLTYRFVDANGLGYKDTTPARSWAAGTPLNDQDPSSIPAESLFSLTISGVPKAGDKISIARTAYPQANNGNAQAMLALRDKAMIAVDGDSPATVTDAYSQMIGNLGVIVQGGQTSADVSGKLLATSEQNLSSQTGVNLDEEAARLIQYQQSYQAAAKVLQIAQSIFDTLLRTAGG